MPQTARRADNPAIQQALTAADRRRKYGLIGGGVIVLLAVLATVALLAF